MNKIKISTPKISLINIIGNPPNSPIKYTLAIVDSGANIHISNKATPKVAPVTISNNVTTSLTYGITMELSRIATHYLTGLTKNIDKFLFYPKLEQPHSYCWGSYVMMDAPSHCTNKIL